LYNVLIFGTGTGCNFLMNALDINKINILAYLDNDSSKWGRFFREKEIISPSGMNSYIYDYIIIGSQYNESIYNQLLNMKVDKSKILQFYKFYDMLCNPVKACIDYYSIRAEEVEAIITGISYARSGVIYNNLYKKAHNFAMYSQDLFYDSKISKHILEKYKNNNIKYAIMGFAYYSFQYDMSLSSMKNRVVLYYDILKDKHNYKEISIEQCEDQYNINKKISDKILKKNENNNYNFSWIMPSLDNYDIEKRIILGGNQAKIDCNKNYPKTVEENKEIFKNYLNLLRDNNIKPIVVVFPASKYYTKYFSKRIEDEFHFIINEFKKKYDFQYIDYFRSDLFEDDDFTDVSHLNTKGAEKFTQILNEEIQW